MLYTNAKLGTATTDIGRHGRKNLQPLFEAIIKTIPEPRGDLNGPREVLVANLDYSDYLGRLAIARVFNGTLRTGEDVAIAKRDGTMEKIKITKLFSFSGLKRTDTFASHRPTARAVLSRFGADTWSEDSDEEMPESESELVEAPGVPKLGSFEVVYRAFDIAQSALTRHTLSAYPPDLLIEVPRSTSRSLDFHRAEEVIAAGRALADQVLLTA